MTVDEHPDALQGAEKVMAFSKVAGAGGHFLRYFGSSILPCGAD